MILSAPKLWQPVQGYCPIEIDFVTPDKICHQDLYLESGNKFVLYRAARLPFTMQDRNRLKEAKRDHLYIQVNSDEDLRDFYQENLGFILDSPQIHNKEKAKIIQFCASSISKQLFEEIDPLRLIPAAQNVVEHSIQFIAKDPENLPYLLVLADKETYIFSHSVNVMTFTLTLLSEAGVKDQNLLNEAGLGALFHDIGKSQIESKILDKPGPLSEDEWQRMRKHPEIGFDILSKGPQPERSKAIVVQHHERLDGQGYPANISGNELSMAVRAVAICDAYDAMTSNRCYQKAMNPVNAFQYLLGAHKQAFDQNLVRHLICALNLKP